MVDEQKCFICGKPVLGIDGQDVVLDTSHLSIESASATKILADEAFGSCHIKCLSESEWGKLWYQNLINYLERVRGYEVLRTLKDHTVMVDHSNSIFPICSHYGYLFTLRLKDFTEIHKSNDKVCIATGSNINVRVDNRENWYAIFSQERASQKPFELLSLIESLGVSDKLIEPDVISEIIISHDMLEKYDVKDTKWLSMFVSHEKSIPDEVYDFLRNHLRMG